MSLILPDDVADIPPGKEVSIEVDGAFKHVAAMAFNCLLWLIANRESPAHNH